MRCSRASRSSSRSRAGGGPSLEQELGGPNRLHAAVHLLKAAGVYGPSRAAGPTDPEEIRSEEARKSLFRGLQLRVRSVVKPLPWFNRELIEARAADTLNRALGTLGADRVDRHRCSRRLNVVEFGVELLFQVIAIVRSESAAMITTNLLFSERGRPSATAPLPSPGRSARPIVRNIIEPGTEVSASEGPRLLLNPDVNLVPPGGCSLTRPTGPSSTT